MPVLRGQAPLFTSRTTLTARLARHAEEAFPELANISVTTNAQMLSALGNKRCSFSPTLPRSVRFQLTCQ